MKRKNFLTRLVLGIAAIPAAIKSFGVPKTVHNVNLWVPLENCRNRSWRSVTIWPDDTLAKWPSPVSIPPVKYNTLIFYPPKNIPRTAYVAFVKSVDDKKGRVYIHVLNPEEHHDGSVSVDLGITEDPYRIVLRK